MMESRANGKQQRLCILFVVACCALFTGHYCSTKQGVNPYAVRVNDPDTPTDPNSFDEVNVSLPCGHQFLMRGHNLRDANIIREFAEDEYGICKATELQDKKNGKVIDIGGNVGTFSIATLLQYPNAKSIVLEPTKINREFIKHNAKVNGVSDRLTVLNSAATVDGRSLFIKWDEVNPANSRMVSKYKPNQSIEEVKSVSLQSVIAKQKYVDIVKIDCEGCEQEILMGTPALMDEKLVGRVVGEIHWVKNERMRCILNRFAQDTQLQFQC
ncbi:hypothetical protein SARC_07591 [Sphaeroforma arctica JP610]|uniref:Methyltransferase FkbM domain-containing protein n=1 Tax=Sphaeroforma arctica JP610 TaxID=667725 RepID=A0A0L0FTB3_9EUKA|nr:hypothetical protein SARC_07591 [Sphaeroforma arctica JP610]KNC80045.1 hypothetical protein SARC_07591 [Sphaeroforma arctica JP610]|eukprot:XP_014153947.1 hypothetical protein SARC_07591 [Sphaeroforma arctica JP610]